MLCYGFRVLSHSLLNGTTSISKVWQCVGVTREVMSPVVCNLAILRNVVPRKKAACSYEKPVNFNTLIR